MMLKKLSAVGVLLALPICGLSQDYDVVVIGGTPAGVSAAISAARAGRTVVIVEQSPVLGGLLSSGVSRADDAVVQANSGVFEEFRKKVENYHLTALASDPVVRDHLARNPKRHNVAKGQAWEAKTAARIYAEMVQQAGSIRTVFGQVPVRTIVEANRIQGVIAKDKAGKEYSYQGKVIVDATYEGDVAAFAGVPFRMGREARSAEEPHAGHIYTDAFCEVAQALPGTIFPGGTGKADEKIQAFNYRFLVKDYGRPDHPYRLKTPPPGYNAKNYKWNNQLKPYLPNRKLDVLGINWGNDWAGPSYRYPIADYAERAKIEKTYRNHALGWLYFIQNEGGSPQLGLADDEFVDNGNFPYRLYVREGRRIEGLYTLTESDMHKDLRGNGLRGPLHKDSIGVGIYEIDSHNVQNPTDRNSGCSGEGAINLIDVTGPYQIPYGVMVPKQLKGLLVPVAISSTHVAISSIRMEPVWSSLGQAAGVAAGIALNQNMELAEVPVPSIQDELLKQGSYLFFYMDVPGDHPAFRSIQQMSLRDAMDGNSNYYFRPAEPINLGDFSRLAVNGMGLPLSITAMHFRDVPRSHSAFRYIETLYDRSTSSGKAFLPFELRDYLNYRAAREAYAYPERPLLVGTAQKILSGLLGREVAPPAGLKADQMLTRAQAADWVASIPKP
ncbi:MAG: FAD-dependent oxidoreductase [Acidobacteria bacterium]|nr:FAD-dependent oxidoreductase [Acidobacteriota bacterium]